MDSRNDDKARISKDKLELLKKFLLKKGQRGHTKSYKQGYKRPSNKDIIQAFYDAKGIIWEACQRLGIKSRNTLYTWINKDAEEGNLELKDGLADSREAAIDFVESKLMSRINGYEHEEDKIFQFKGRGIIVPTIKHYPPDVGAIALYLKANAKHRGYGDSEEDPEKERPLTFEEQIKGLNAISQPYRENNSDSDDSEDIDGTET